MPSPGTLSTSPTVGNDRSVELGRLVDVIEHAVGKAIRELAPLQPGDVPETRADVADLMHEVGFWPVTSIEEGVRRFVTWFKKYHHLD